MNNKTNTTITATLRRIIANIAAIIDIGYFREFIGQTRAFYLLVYIAGLIICKKNASLDDTIIEKEYSRHIEYAAYAWSSKLERPVMGIHFVALYWSDGTVRVPVGFRLWIPRKKTANYRTKVDLALDLITRNEEFCRTCDWRLAGAGGKRL